MDLRRKLLALAPRVKDLIPVLGVSQTKVSCSEKTKAAAVLVTGNNQSKRTHCFSNGHGRNPRREAEFKPVPDRL